MLLGFCSEKQQQPSLSIQPLVVHKHLISGTGHILSLRPAPLSLGNRVRRRLQLYGETTASYSPGPSLAALARGGVPQLGSGRIRERSRGVPLVTPAALRHGQPGVQEPHGTPAGQPHQGLEFRTGMLDGRDRQSVAAPA